MRRFQLLQVLIFSFLFSATENATAGIKWIDVGVNGLTCSMCSRSVEMSIKRLDFVDSVVMSLEKTEGRVYLKENAIVNLKEIARAIVNAGFSVRFLRLEFNFNDVSLSNNGVFTFQGQTYQWLDFNDQLKNNNAILKLVDDDFLPKKESNQWKKKFGSSYGPGNEKIFHLIHEG